MAQCWGAIRPEERRNSFNCPFKKAGRSQPTLLLFFLSPPNKVLIWSIRPGLFFFLPSPKALCPEVLAVAMPVLLWSWVGSTSLCLLAGGVGGRRPVLASDGSSALVPSQVRRPSLKVSSSPPRGIMGHGEGVLGALWLGARHSSALHWFVSVAAALCEGPARPLFLPICLTPALQEQQGSSPQACPQRGHCWVA